MANITNELAQIMKAVLGKDVRGSIHDAIYKINDVGEHQIDAGNLFKDGDSAAGYYDKSVYINTETMTLLKSNGSVWVAQDTIKGETGNGIDHIDKTNVDVLTDEYTIFYTDGTEQKYTVINGKGIVQITKTTEGLKDTYTIKYNDNTEYVFELNNGRGIISILKKSSDGSIDKYEIKYNDETTSEFEVTNGNKWYRGMNISGKAVNPTVYAGSGADGIKYARVDDYYMNPSEGSIYYCVREGDPEHAEWVYDFTLAGGGSGVSTWADLLNKPFTYVGNAGLDISGASAADYTLKVKVDGSYISFDENGALTLASDIVSKLYKYYTGHFRTDDVTKMVYLADDVTKKLPNAVPTSAQKGYAPVVQEDGSVKWAKIGGGSTYLLKIHCVPNDHLVVDDITGGATDNVYDDYPTTSVVQLEVDLGKEYGITMTKLDMSKSDYKTVEISGTKPIEEIYMGYFTAYVKVKTNIGASGYLENQTSGEKVPVNKSSQEEQTITVTDKGVWRFVSQLYGNTKYNDDAIINIEGETANTSVYFGVFDVTWDNHSEFDNATLVMTNASGTDTYEQTTDTSGIIHFATKNAEEYTITKKNTSYAVKGTTVLGSAITKKIETMANITIDVYSARSAVVIAKNENGDTIGTCTTSADDDGKGSMTISIKPNGENITFEDTTVGKDILYDGHNFEKVVLVTKETKSVNVMPDGALYWYGSKCAHGLGGGMIANGDRTVAVFNEHNVSVTVPIGSHRSGVTTIKTIDLSKFNTLNSLIDAFSGQYFLAVSTKNDDDGIKIPVKQETLSKTGKVSLDVSSITDKLYAMVHASSNSTTSRSFTCSALWLE